MWHCAMFFRPPREGQALTPSPALVPSSRGLASTSPTRPPSTGVRDPSTIPRPSWKITVTGSAGRVRGWGVQAGEAGMTGEAGSGAETGKKHGGTTAPACSFGSRRPTGAVWLPLTPFSMLRESMARYPALTRPCLAPAVITAWYTGTQAGLGTCSSQPSSPTKESLMARTWGDRARLRQPRSRPSCHLLMDSPYCLHSH